MRKLLFSAALTLFAAQAHASREVIRIEPRFQPPHQPPLDLKLRREVEPRPPSVYPQPPSNMLQQRPQRTPPLLRNIIRHA